MTEDLFSVARKMQEKVEKEMFSKEMISKLGVGSIFEGAGNIINIIGRVIKEGGAPQKELVRRSPPIRSGDEGR